MASPPVDPVSCEALVCVVDPDPAARRSIATLLAPLGARVEGYSTAHELLARLARGAPACLIVESRLPDMGAPALLQAIKARGISIPTIVLAIDDDVGSAVAAIRAGALDYMEKPHIDRALLTRVAAILEDDERRTH
jgi:FixJ family two-component response regulator